MDLLKVFKNYMITHYNREECDSSVIMNRMK